MSTSIFRKVSVRPPLEEEQSKSRASKSLTSSELAAKLSIPWEDNMDHEAVLFQYYRLKGAKKLHYCPDWDGMAIHQDSPEFAACTCDKSELP